MSANPGFGLWTVTVSGRDVFPRHPVPSVAVTVMQYTVEMPATVGRVITGSCAVRVVGFSQFWFAATATS
jgi:hypothetical protein